MPGQARMAAPARHEAVAPARMSGPSPDAGPTSPMPHGFHEVCVRPVGRSGPPPVQPGRTPAAISAPARIDHHEAPPGLTARFRAPDQEITDRTAAKRERSRHGVAIRQQGRVVRVGGKEDDHANCRADRPSSFPTDLGSGTLVPADLALQTPQVTELGLDLDNGEAPRSLVECQQVDPARRRPSRISHSTAHVYPRPSSERRAAETQHAWAASSWSARPMTVGKRRSRINSASRLRAMRSRVLSEASAEPVSTAATIDRDTRASAARSSCDQRRACAPPGRAIRDASEGEQAR